MYICATKRQIPISLRKQYSIKDIYENDQEEDLLCCWDPLVLAELLAPQLITERSIREVYVSENDGFSYGSVFARKAIKLWIREGRFRRSTNAVRRDAKHSSDKSLVWIGIENNAF